MDVIGTMMTAGFYLPSLDVFQEAKLNKYEQIITQSLIAS